MTTRPNFLFISTHDINPHLSTYAGVWPGAEQARTPRLDRLAAEGVRFDQAMASAPVCAPSRASVFTGRYPTAIGTMHMRSNAVPPADVELFPQTLRRAGYQTTNNWFTDVNFDVPPTAFDDCSGKAHWRDRPDPETPFFAAFHGMTTHESQVYAEGERLERMLAAVPAHERIGPDDVEVPPYHPDTEVFRAAWSTYFNLIAAMDRWVGDLLDQLEEDGLADDTVVIFWSDHGAGFPGAKRWATEAGVRVPLIIRWPGRITGGTVRTEVVQLQDLAATVLAMAGVPAAGPLNGVPLYDRSGTPGAAAPYAFSARDRMVDDRDTSRSVRDERYRYVRHLHPDRPWMQYSHFPEKFATWRELRELRYQEAAQAGNGALPGLLTDPQRRLVAPSKDAEELFDIREDPHQTTNLADSPELAGKLTELRTALDEWLASTGDLGLLPEEDLLRQWGPTPDRPQAETPEVTVADGTLTAEVTDSSTAIGWTTQAPGERPELPLETMLGHRMTFPHAWRLYTEPVEVDADVDTVWVRAWRLGHSPSEVVRITGLSAAVEHAS